MFRVVVITNIGQVKSDNKNTLDECYDYILTFIEPKHYRIADTETKQVLEDENGKRG